jgi:phage head maturation protease
MTTDLLVGRAAPFNAIGRDNAGYVDSIAPGAFTAAIRRGDVVARVDHLGKRPNEGGDQFIIARQADDTLRLWQTAAGLYLELRLVDTWWRHVLHRYAHDGRLRGWSVAWGRRHAIGWESPPPMRRRRVVDVHRLTEISLMVSADPAYRETWAALDSPAARARILREEHEALERQLVDLLDLDELAI